MQPRTIARQHNPAAQGEIYPRGLGNEDENTEAQVQAKAAEVARIIATWQEPVAKSHRELSAGDDDDRRLPGH